MATQTQGEHHLAWAKTRDLKVQMSLMVKREKGKIHVVFEGKSKVQFQP